jgi:glucose/arabinose dehydrogenase
MKSEKASFTKLLVPAATLAGLLLAVHSCSPAADQPSGPQPPPGMTGMNPPPSNPPPSNPPPTTMPPGNTMPPPSNPPPTTMPPGNPPTTPPGNPPAMPPGNPPITPPAAGDFKPCDSQPAMAAPDLKRTGFAKLPDGSQAGQVVGPPGEKGLVYALAHKTGAVYAIQNGMLVAEPFAKVTVGSFDREQGLLSMTFHPDFAKNQIFYLSYVAPNKGMVVDEFKRLTATTSMPSQNIYKRDRNVGNNFHNGGTIFFNPKDGPDKPWLYHSVGNWNSGDSPKADAFLGRVLRYDVSTKMGVPGKTGGVGGFTFVYGLRNPYRMSIDRLTGDMYIGDVAQGKGGAVFYVPYGKDGINFGYGDNNSELNGGNSLTGVDRSSDAIIGGVVYRGNKIPGLCGRYFYGFYKAGMVKSLVVQGGKATGQQTHDTLTVSGLSSFGEDGEGELYMASHDTNQIFKIEAAGGAN